MDNVVKLAPPATFDADEMLEMLKGLRFSKILVISDFEDGSFMMDGNCNAGEALFLMEQVKHHLVVGDDA